MANIDITDQGGGSLSNGILQLENGVAMDTTLRYVADQLNTKSQLLLATNATTVEGTLKIKTANVEYLDVEDTLGNNRFTISKAVGSQKVDLDFASNPTSPTDIVGGIRTFQDGVNLSDSLFFRKNGQATFTERVNVEGDSSVTTQTSSVIRSTTTNANLVIAPNGTGALIASIPDGTITGGNARGANAVDFQMVRYASNNVASGNYSFLIGTGSRASGAYSVALGDQNISSGTIAFSLGVGVTASGTRSFVQGSYSSGTGLGSICFGDGCVSGTGQYTTVSGGQYNNATGVNATVVGGQSNTSSGSKSVSGGEVNTASGTNATAFGANNTASGINATAFGGSNIASAVNSIAINSNSTAYLRGQLASASGLFVANSDAQQSLLTARREATLTTGATTILSLDGTGTTNLIIPTGNNRMWNVQVRWVAVVTAITGTATGVTVGDTKTSTDLLAVARRAGNTTVSAHTSAGTHAIETVAGSLTAANIAYSAGASQEMAITFTGPTFAGGGSVTMRVVAAISLTEVAY